MAGAGYKLFNTGDVLTAAQVNTYLQEQAVMVFADATARTTALSGVLAEGMITYLKSDDKVYKYTGSAWVEVGGSTSPLTTKGDLYTYSTADARLGVGSNNQTLLADSSAATGLKWAASATSTLTTTGDILYASSANTLARLGIGSSGQVLTVSGGVPAWAAAAGGGGKVLQVVQGSYSTTVSVSSSSYADTGLSASITPSATSSKVLVLVNLGGCGVTGSNAAGQFKLFRSTTEIQLITIAAGYTAGAHATNIIGSVSATYLDSPSTTSSTTYKIQIASKSGESSSVMNYDYSGAYGVTPKSTITLLEIGA